MEVLCFDSSPHIIFDKKFSVPQGMMAMADAKHMLLTTRPWGVQPLPNPESVVVSLDDGREIARVQAIAASTVRLENGTLDGLFQTQPHGALLNLDGSERWRTSERMDDSAAVLVIGDTVVVATYGRITTGAELYAFDRATGTRKWRGDVELIPIAHSKYSNRVELRFSSGTIVMQGVEAMQDYLELFDPQTGKRLFSTVRLR
jgi:outer membrane protein assembly factor BamB